MCLTVNRGSYFPYLGRLISHYRLKTITSRDTDIIEDNLNYIIGALSYSSFIILYKYLFFFNAKLTTRRTFLPFDCADSSLGPLSDNER